MLSALCIIKLFIKCNKKTTTYTHSHTHIYKYIYIYSRISAVLNSAVIWVLAMLSPMPKSSIDPMSRFGTVPRVSITIGRMAVST